MSHTYTYAILEISPTSYAEIAAKLRDADYGEAFHEHDGREVIDMHGIAVAADPIGTSEDFDAAANLDNHKCERWLGALEYGWLDALAMDWTAKRPKGCHAKRIWLNPPYGSGLGRWTAKCLIETTGTGATVVALLPARTDTVWFQDCWRAQHLIFLRGRLRFIGGKDSAPFPSVIAVFSNRTWPVEQLGDLGQIVNPVSQRVAA